MQNIQENNFEKVFEVLTKLISQINSKYS